MGPYPLSWTELAKGLSLCFSPLPDRTCVQVCVSVCMHGMHGGRHTCTPGCLHMNAGVCMHPCVLLERCVWQLRETSFTLSSSSISEAHGQTWIHFAAGKIEPQAPFPKSLRGRPRVGLWSVFSRGFSLLWVRSALLVPNFRGDVVSVSASGGCQALTFQGFRKFL